MLGEKCPCFVEKFPAFCENFPAFQHFMLCFGELLRPCGS